jgi:hypothetical protein
MDPDPIDVFRLRGKSHTSSTIMQIQRRAATHGFLTLLLLLTACAPTITFTRRAPAQRSLGPARRLVLVEADSEIRDLVVPRLIDEVHADGAFEIADASSLGVRLSDLGEGVVSADADCFRVDWPADVYVGVKIVSLPSKDFPYYFRHESEGVTEDIICELELTMADARTGRPVASIATKGKAESVTTFSLEREDRPENRPISALPVSEVLAERSELQNHASGTNLAIGSAIDHAIGAAMKQFTPQRIMKKMPLEKDAPDAKEATALIGSGDLGGARRLWKETQKRFSNDPRLDYNLGALSEALGNLKAAAVYYREATRLAPGKAKYRRALETLR